MPVGCMHCDQPSCRDVCPSTATRKREDGIVTIDYDICIGCAYCAVACPYQARYRVDVQNAAYGGHPMLHEAKREHWDRRGVAQKCSLCVEIVDAGLARGLVPGVDLEATPACVGACISGALQMGDLDDPDSTVSQALRAKRHFRMHEGLGNGPNIYYLYDAKTDEPQAPEPPLVAEPVGLAAVSPKHQANWDWRAAANFIAGGSGTALYGTVIAAGLAGPVLWPGAFAALVLVAAGLLCIWTEIGRPERILNTFRNPWTSWMTREAMAALAFFGLGGLGWLFGSITLGVLGALGGLGFLYCQGRILAAAKGIPAWREPAVVALIVATGLTEGLGLYAVLALVAGAGGAGWLAPVLAALAGLRYAAWHRYRAALGRSGAPTAALKALDAPQTGLTAPVQGVIAVLALAALLLPAGQGAVLAVAGLGAVATGWLFKLRLITRAGFTQGYAIGRMPARGSGTSGAGIQPGWSRG